MKKHLPKLISLSLIFSLFSLSSCIPLAVGAAGVAGGYIAKERGYEFQSPITKSDSDEE